MVWKPIPLVIRCKIMTWLFPYSTWTTSLSWTWVLPLGTHAMFFSFNAWALSLCNFFFYQFDKPSGRLGCTSVLGGNTSFLIFVSFNSFCSDLTHQISLAEFPFILLLIAEVLNTLIGFSSLKFRSEILSLQPSLLLDRLAWPPFSYYEVRTNSSVQISVSEYVDMLSTMKFLELYAPYDMF